MATAWLAAGQQGADGSALGRAVLVAVAVLAVSAFAILQAKARSRPRRPAAPRRRPPSQRRRRRPGPSDWRAEPPLYWPEARDDEPPSGNAQSSRPDWRYGYPPGYEPYPLYDPARSPWAARDRSSLPQTGPSGLPMPTLRV